MMPYTPLFARYYDLLVHGNTVALATQDDLQFIEQAFKRAGAVREILDAGCGTGRYLVPLAKQGYHLTGLDNSPEMLAQCVERLTELGLSATLVEQDLREWHETERYDVIVCMNSVIAYFLETGEMLEILSRFREALRPGGLLILEVWNILANMPSLDVPVTQEICVDKTGALTCETIDRYDPARGIFHIQLNVKAHQDGNAVSFTHEEALRVFTTEEMTSHLATTGFANVTAHIRPDTLDPESGDEELVFLALKPYL